MRVEKGVCCETDAGADGRGGHCFGGEGRTERGKILHGDMQIRVRVSEGEGGGAVAAADLLRKSYLSRMNTHQGEGDTASLGDLTSTIFACSPRLAQSYPLRRCEMSCAPPCAIRDWYCPYVSVQVPVFSAYEKKLSVVLWAIWNAVLFPFPSPSASESLSVLSRFMLEGRAISSW